MAAAIAAGEYVSGEHHSKLRDAGRVDASGFWLTLEILESGCDSSFRKSLRNRHATPMLGVKRRSARTDQAHPLLPPTDCGMFSIGW